MRGEGRKAQGDSRAEAELIACGARRPRRFGNARTAASARAIGADLVDLSNVHWLATCPALAAIREPAWLAAVAAAKLHGLRARRRLFADHELNEHFLVVISGWVQVYRSLRGRELALYRLGPGDICLYNGMARLMGRAFYEATAITETDVELAVIPADLYQTAFLQAPAFHRYVLQELATRVTNVMQVIEGIVFERLDVRLARLLLARACAVEGCVCVTHQDIAKELGSSREVISRLLKEFERKTWISLARGEIRVRSASDLHDFIRAHAPVAR